MVSDQLSKRYLNTGAAPVSPCASIQAQAAPREYPAIESAAAPVEVGEYTHAQRESMIAAMRRDAAEYCLFGLDYLSSAAHDYATLARQLAESESALAAATRRVAEVEGLLREAAEYTRHPDYEWDSDFANRVHATLKEPK